MQVRTSEPEFPRLAGARVSALGFPALCAAVHPFLHPCWGVSRARVFCGKGTSVSATNFRCDAA